MKNLVLLATTMALSAPVWAQGGEFDAVKSSWKDVRLGTQELDAAIAKKKLADVHAAAFNLRDSVRELRDAPLESDGAMSKLVSLIGQVDALANALDSAGDKNDLRGAITSQRKMHVLLDQIAALFPAGTIQKIGAVTATSPATDPVCGMKVSPANSPKVAYNGQTYYFCSAADANTFKKAPAKYVARAEGVAYGQPKTYNFSVATGGKVEVGKPANLAFSVQETGKPGLVKKFQLVHEKLIHLIVVNEDLSYFSHEHPDLGTDNRFHLQTRFAKAGKYFLFGDFTPADGLNQILRAEVNVAGPKAPAVPLTVDKALSRTVDGISVSLKLSKPLQVGKSSLLTYTLQKNGKPLTDMEHYLGAMGHLMAINRNGRDAVHTHTVAAGGAVTSAMATANGPRFTYDLTPKAAGVTKIWAQFQRGGKVLTVPFTLNVSK